MSEKDLNIKYIQDKTGLIDNDELIQIILDMMQESYKLGLCQSEIDNTMGLIEENEELKKQLEDANEKILLLQASEPMLNYKKSLEETQQKKFIKYLENEIKQNTPNVRWKHYNEDGFNDYDVENPSCIEMRPTNKILKEILQKYKSIIGASDENKRN